MRCIKMQVNLNDFVLDKDKAVNDLINESRHGFQNQLIANSKANNYAEAVLEWSFYDYRVNHEGARCACMQPIINEHIMYNATTDRFMTVGSTCFAKYFSGSDDLMSQFKSIKSFYRDYKVIMRKFATFDDISNCYDWEGINYVNLYEYVKRSGNIISLLLIINSKYRRLFNDYDAKFLTFMTLSIGMDFNWYTCTREQQNYFYVVFSEKVMPILYRMYGPVKGR